MSEFIILAVLILIVGIVLYTKKHPEVAGEIHARLDETERRVQSMIDSRKPSAPVAVETTTNAPPPQVVDHVGIVTAAMQGAAQVVSSLPTPSPAPAPATPVVETPPVDPLASYGVTTAARTAPSAPVVEVGPAGPPAVRADQDGRDLWIESFWRCNLGPGGSASRNFTVPEGYTGVIEYFADNAAMQGDFLVTLDGRPLVGAGETLGKPDSPLPTGLHTLGVQCVNPLSAGRTWATAALSIRHAP